MLAVLAVVAPPVPEEPEMCGYVAVLAPVAFVARSVHLVIAPPGALVVIFAVLALVKFVDSVASHVDKAPEMFGLLPPL